MYGNVQGAGLDNMRTLEQFLPDPSLQNRNYEHKGNLTMTKLGRTGGSEGGVCVKYIMLRHLKITIKETRIVIIMENSCIIIIKKLYSTYILVEIDYTESIAKKK